MRNRTLLLGTLALGALALALVLTDTSSAPAAKPAEAPLVPAGLLADLRAVEITAGGKTARIERGPAGWVVPARFGLPADADQRLRPLLQSLRAARTLGTLTADPRRLERLALTDSLTLTGADGATWKLAVGRMTDDGLGAAVRPEGSAAALRSTFAGALEGDPANWIDPVLAAFPADQALGLAVTFPDGSKLALTRDKAGEPLKGAEGPLLMAGEEWLYSLSTLRALDAVAPDDAAAAAALARPLVAEVTLAGGAKLTATFGRAAGAAGEPARAWMRATHSDPAHPANARSARATFVCPPWLAEQLVGSVAELAKRGEPPAPQAPPMLELEAAPR